MSDPVDVVARCFCDVSRGIPCAEWTCHECRERGRDILAELEAAGLKVMAREATKEMVAAALKEQDEGEEHVGSWGRDHYWHMQNMLKAAFAAAPTFGSPPSPSAASGDE